MAAPEGTHAPGGHPRTLSRPSGAGRGHQSHPQDSRRQDTRRKYEEKGGRKTENGDFFALRHGGACP